MKKLLFGLMFLNSVANFADAIEMCDIYTKNGEKDSRGFVFERIKKNGNEVKVTYAWDESRGQDTTRHDDSLGKAILSRTLPTSGFGAEETVKGPKINGSIIYTETDSGSSQCIFGNGTLTFVDEHKEERTVEVGCSDCPSYRDPK